MRYPAIRRRLWALLYARQLIQTSFTTTGTGPGVSLDLGELLGRLELRDVLKGSGLRGNV